MRNKKLLGQYFSTNADYICQGIQIDIDLSFITIIEPFSGDWDLINWLKNQYPDTHFTIKAYDIDPKNNETIQRDTLMDPPDYSNTFVITNPPYLAKNKCKGLYNTLFSKYQYLDDLYKTFIMHLIHSKVEGGIIIIPLNFFCSIRKRDIELRQMFITKYTIHRVNVFEEPVFQDTSYTVCCIYFTSRPIQDKPIPFYFYPSDKKIDVKFNTQNNYTIGGSIYNLPQHPEILIFRLTKLNYEPMKPYITNVVISCIDGKQDNNRIQARYVTDDEIYIDTTPKLSARSYITLIIKPLIDKQQQIKFINYFNDFLETKRQETHSLFLTNYREYTRKRISFQLVFQISNYIISKINK